MGRILAIDYGMKRTGIAVTDPLKLIANGLTTVSTHELFLFLKTYLEKEKVELFIIGKPMTVQNKPSETLPYVEQCVRKLKEMFPDIPVQMVDERFTTRIAQQAILDGGVKKKGRQDKALVDKISAVVILQSYMESVR